MPSCIESGPVLRLVQAFAIAILLVVASHGEGREVQPVLLTGEDLTLDQVVRVTRDGAAVEVADAAWQRVERSHALLLLAGKENLPVYGLNRGVGLHKDRTIFVGDAIDPEVRAISEQFNRNLLLSHSVGVGPEASRDVVRAALLARLNTMLFGGTGVQPAIAGMYAEFLNRGIHPVLLTRGSIGEADITILPGIGLAIMGEGEVHVGGKRMSAAAALQAAGLEPVKPFAKDGLTILSSNAYAAGMAALLVADIERVIDIADVVFAASLEGLNGNVSPLLPPVQQMRPFPGQVRTAERMLDHLDGSYLWQLSEARPLQDPLSFRTASQVHGAARDILVLLKRQLEIQLNSSDDNPAVVLDVRPPDGAPPQVRKYYVEDGPLYGAVFSTANFDPIPWVLNVQSLGPALSHLSNASVQRTVKLSTPDFTKLTRFLTPNDGTLAYTTIQKTFSALDTEIRALSTPVSVDATPVAGNIEDVASNAPIVVQRVDEIVDNLYHVLAIELMHAAQAVDLRRRDNPDLAIGDGTGEMLAAYRAVVPFLDQDRYLAADIRASYEFLADGDMSQMATAAGR